MNESQISVRYAKALFQIAAEKKLLDEVSRDMELLMEVCKMGEFQFVLAQPSLQASKKCKMIDSVLTKYLTEISLSMINLVIRNNREMYLPAIARNFGEFSRRARGIRSASLVTAQPVEQNEISRLKKLINKAFKEEVVLTQQVDEEIIGGFVLTIEDLQYDASVARSLKKMKEKLMHNSLEK
jgi:F-type H+-transporting ATPase subunit delta